MSEATEVYTAKTKSKSAAAAFEMPKFEMPKFEVPKMEVPAAFREIAEKSVSQAKEAYEKMRSATEEATDMIEDTYATASKGASDYGLKCIEMARANTNAALDFFSDLMTVKSLSEAVEIVDRACAQAVRDAHRAEQGPRRARPEGRNRDRRAGQGRRHQGVQESRLRRRPGSAATLSCEARTFGSGLCLLTPTDHSAPRAARQCRPTTHRRLLNRSYCS